MVLQQILTRLLVLLLCCQVGQQHADSQRCEASFRMVIFCKHEACEDDACASTDAALSCLKTVTSGGCEHAFDAGKLVCLFQSQWSALAYWHSQEQ